MKPTHLLPTLLLAASSIAAQGDAWLLQDGLTPAALSSDGALLTSTDSLAWPDGTSVFVTYWLGVNDAVIRCAELRDGGAISLSCWRQEIVVATVTASGNSVARRISTRRRPLVYTVPQPYAVTPHVWVAVHR